MAFLITLEGGEGSGKGSVAKKLSEYLSTQGHKVKNGREPGSVEISEKIRNIIQSPDSNMNPITELLLFEAARSEFTTAFLQPALNDFDIVILDRFYDSTTAYQGYGRGLDLYLINTLNNHATKGIIPDLTLLLDVSPSVGLKRCEKHEFGKDGDRFEQESLKYHEKVREGYLKIAEENPERVIVVDAENNNLDQVIEIVKGIIKKRLEER